MARWEVIQERIALMEMPLWEGQACTMVVVRSKGNFQGGRLYIWRGNLVLVWVASVSVTSLAAGRQLKLKARE
jgi:hypothetical protein